MDVLKAVAATVGVAFVLNLALLWSHLLVFMLAGRPAVWILLAGLIGLVSVPACDALGLSHSVVFWGATFALLLRIPPKPAKGIIHTTSKAPVNKSNGEMGLQRERLKYRLGLGAYAFGCVVGYVLAYAEVTGGDG